MISSDKSYFSYSHLNLFYEKSSFPILDDNKNNSFLIITFNLPLITNVDVY